MPAAVVGGIIAGAGSIGAAAIGAHAAGKAADQQVAAGDKALALQKDIYNQQQANEAPWRNTGAAAITSLGGLLGLPQAPAGGGSGQLPTNTLGSTFDAPISPGQANFAGYSPSGGYIGKDVPMTERMKNPAVNVDASGYTAQQHGASSYAAPTVRMQAPNGEIEMVPESAVSHYEQQGAKVIGRA
jgi:hypothetical protein